MGKQVKVYTTATNPDTGETVNLTPGDEAPSWAKLGDHVFEEQSSDETPMEPVAGPSQTAFSRQQKADLEKQLAATEKSGDKVSQTRTSDKPNKDA